MNGHAKVKTVSPLGDRLVAMTILLTGLVLVSASVFAQVPVDESGKPLGGYSEEAFDDAGIGDASGAGDADVELLDAMALQELVGPIALYPDDLLAIILPASTFPLEIVQAARFLDALEEDSTLEPDEDWDDAVVALLNYPEVIRMMDEDIDWTWRLGDAVLAQQTDVIAAVESFRDRAYAAGNLKSDEHQEVSYDDGVIEIAPMDDEIIYVPYYDPVEVVVAQPRRVYYYYPDPYPVYYYPYPVDYRFRTGFFWGVTTAYTIGWSHHYLHVYHPSYWGHPYYGRYYYGHYYRRPSITVYNNYYVNRSRYVSPYRYRDGDRWQHRRRSEARVVNNYHYASNGSRNSRDFTVTRQDRIRTGDNGRRQSTASTGSNRATSTRNRNTITFRDRTSGPSTDSGNRTVNRQADTRGSNSVATTHDRRQDARAEIRFRDRSSENRARTPAAAANRTTGTAGRQAGPRPSTMTSRAAENRSSIRLRDHSPSAASTRTAATGRSVPSGTRRPANVPRATAPASSARQPSAANARAPSRPSAGTSAPAARAPSAPRANTRATSRGENKASSERRSSTRRVRSNDD